MINIITEDGKRLINYNDVSVIYVHPYTSPEKGLYLIKASFTDGSNTYLTKQGAETDIIDKFHKLCDAITKSPIGNIVIDMRTL